MEGLGIARADETNNSLSILISLQRREATLAIHERERNASAYDFMGSPIRCPFADEHDYPRREDVKPPAEVHLKTRVHCVDAGLRVTVRSAADHIEVSNFLE